MSAGAVLDLVVTLSEPPTDAPPTTLAQYELSYGRLRARGELVDPADDATREQLRWYLEESWQWPYGEFATRARQVEQRLEQLGRAFYDAIFDTPEAQRVVQPWNLQPNAARQISLELNLSEEQLDGVAPVDPRVFTALSLPWELLHDGRTFLALRPRNPVALVRRLPEQSLGALDEPFTPPLRILLITARPDDAGFIDPRGIARPLYDAVEDEMAAGELVIEYLRPPTLAALVARLGDPQQPPVHVLHFDGHGTFVAQEQPALPADGVRLAGGGLGALAFENDQGGLHLVKADDLANVLGQSGVKLAVLTACESAVGSADDAFSSVAGRLIKGGVDAVIAMRASLLVATATRYVKTFYDKLAGNASVLLAHAQAHQQLFADPARHVLQRTKDAPGEPVTLRDWWVPQIYQQRLLNFTAEAPAQPMPLLVAERPLSHFPAPPRYGFGGRARELLDLERYLRQGKLVLIHGFGGQGKTALASEAADWLTRTGMYRGALFASLEGTVATATWLLGELGRHLGCDDGQYDPAQHAAALARLRPLLRTQPTLLVVDNVETILPRGEAPLSDAERTALWDVVLTLRQYGMGVLLTTRDTELGDARFQPGQHVQHLYLRGLSEADAYVLASRLLEAHGIPRERAPYPELMQLLAQLDYHPLAIALVLPALADEPMNKVLAEFSTLLGKFMDADVPGRNQSLLTSLNYSLRRLTEEQRALLPRLALFEGGASEDDLLAITKIPEETWRDLRRGLEHAALISAEKVPDIGAPFLRFHPVLAPALRGQGAADSELRVRYAHRYYALADWFYTEDTRQPQSVRALVRRELPNLRRAVILLRDQGEHAAVVDIVNRIVWFLSFFGLERELAELRVQQAEAAKLAAQGDGTLRRAEYLHVSGQGEDAWDRGDMQTAYNTFTALLARIEQQPAGVANGPGSYEHCATLYRLARCLKDGQPGAAEQLMHRTLTLLEALLAATPEYAQYISLRGYLFADLGDVLRKQGRYAAARKAYEDSLAVARQQGNERSEGVALAQLGTLAYVQGNYDEARQPYTQAISLFRKLNEPRSEATGWHQLGMVAHQQQQWAEAERCYRASLAISERLGHQKGVSGTSTQLAVVARLTDRPAEAEGWLKRAITIDEQLNDHPGLSRDLNNLANLLTTEIRAGRMGRERLAEARSCAERALAISETLDLSSEPWTTLSILAGVAKLEGQPVKAAEYSRRERETFAQFPGNRWRIDQAMGHLIRAIAAACSDEALRAQLEAVLPDLEQKGWMIADATRRIWAGERDWHTLAEGIDRNSALLILRVLETLADPSQGPALPEEPEQAAEERSGVPPALAQALATLPEPVRVAIEQQDQAAFEHALAALPPDEQQAVLEALRPFIEQGPPS